MKLRKTYFYKMTINPIRYSNHQMFGDLNNIYDLVFIFELNVALPVKLNK